VGVKVYSEQPVGFDFDILFPSCGLADVQEKIEILARAAEALGDPAAATAFRAMIQRPPVVSDAEWQHYLQARRTHIRQPEDRLG
jgi:hypothetical protein